MLRSVRRLHVHVQCTQRVLGSRHRRVFSTETYADDDAYVHPFVFVPLHQRDLESERFNKFEREFEQFKRSYELPIVTRFVEQQRKKEAVATEARRAQRLRQRKERKQLRREREEQKKAAFDAKIAKLDKIIDGAKSFDLSKEPSADVVDTLAEIVQEWEPTQKESDMTDEQLMDVIQTELKHCGLAEAIVEPRCEEQPTSTNFSDEDLYFVYRYNPLARAYARNNGEIRDANYRERKATMYVRVSALELSAPVFERLLSLVKERYDERSGILKLVCSRHPNREQNMAAVKSMLRSLLAESYKVDDNYLPPHAIEDAPLHRSAQQSAMSGDVSSLVDVDLGPAFMPHTYLEREAAALMRPSWRDSLHDKQRFVLFRFNNELVGASASCTQEAFDTTLQRLTQDSQ